jgi:hypothetical protein
VNGTVLDPAGAAVPGDKVSAVNTSADLEVRPDTDADGRYTFPPLPPGGPYSITVVAAGFNTEEHAGITLEVNQAARIDFTLKIGATTETVQVTADAQLNESTTAAMGQQLPARTSLVSRSISAILILWPFSRRACRVMSASLTTT